MTVPKAKNSGRSEFVRIRIDSPRVCGSNLKFSDPLDSMYSWNILLESALFFRIRSEYSSIFRFIRNSYPRISRKTIVDISSINYGRTCVLISDTSLSGIEYVGVSYLTQHVFYYLRICKEFGIFHSNTCEFNRNTTSLHSNTCNFWTNTGKLNTHEFRDEHDEFCTRILANLSRMPGIYIWPYIPAPAKNSRFAFDFQVYHVTLFFTMRHLRFII